MLTLGLLFGFVCTDGASKNQITDGDWHKAKQLKEVQLSSIELFTNVLNNLLRDEKAGISRVM